MKAREADPVVAEIRETRHRISARFGHDPRRLVDYYVRKQDEGQEGDRARSPDGSVGEREPVGLPGGPGDARTVRAEERDEAVE